MHQKREKERIANGGFYNHTNHTIQNDEDESIFLSPLKKILESGKSPAETWKNLFLSEWNENIDKIYKANYFKILEHNEKI